MLNAKSKGIRSAFLNATVIGILSQLDTVGVDGNLFINRQTGKPYTTIMKARSRLRSKAGLPQLRIHELRHRANRQRREPNSYRHSCCASAASPAASGVSKRRGFWRGPAVPRGSIRSSAAGRFCCWSVQNDATSLLKRATDSA
jgi:hypothetical protein